MSSTFLTPPSLQPSQMLSHPLSTLLSRTARPKRPFVPHAALFRDDPALDISSIVPPQVPLQHPSRKAKPPIPKHPPNRRERKQFDLVAPHPPAGDQPKVISYLTRNLLQKQRFQTLHGVTGSGKTFMMANVIAQLNRPTLVLAPNKTLAAQLCNELARYFPNNRVEFFVSHFKFYQPEAYLPASDKYIAKASAVDEDIDRLRHAATKALFEQNDTIVVASVSSIYGLGLPGEYLDAAMRVYVGETWQGVERLKGLMYIDGGTPLKRGEFCEGPDWVDISPPWEKEGVVYRIHVKDQLVTAMERIDKEGMLSMKETVVYPAKHFMTPKERIENAARAIELEAERCVAAFVKEGKTLEAGRLQERVSTDMEMLRKVGFCSGAENYTLYLSGRYLKSDRGIPETLLDYMPKDGQWLLFIDESHVTVPQLGAMYAGNAARKKKLVRHGFRLPSAMENRPLSAKEFWGKVHQTVFVSATPGPFELEKSGGHLVEAVIRPTGVLDPTIEVVGTKGQLDHLRCLLRKTVSEGGKAIVMALTKKFAEDVAEGLDGDLKVGYLHSDIDAVGRMEVLEGMRGDGLDVVVGVNLLREGIDLPRVRVMAILDADAEGFLRGETALIQMIGRVARNVDGHVVMYADTVTGGMHRAIAETGRRRRLQMAYNDLWGITARKVGEGIGGGLLERIRKLRMKEEAQTVREHVDQNRNEMGKWGKDAEEVERRMREAAKVEDFETAALLRDHLARLRSAND